MNDSKPDPTKRRTPPEAETPSAAAPTKPIYKSATLIGPPAEPRSALSNATVVSSPAPPASGSPISSSGGLAGAQASSRANRANLNATVPGVAPHFERAERESERVERPRSHSAQSAQGFALPSVLDANATIPDNPDEPFLEGGVVHTRKMPNATMLGMGAVSPPSREVAVPRAGANRNVTEPMMLPLPLDARATQVGMPPPSDPFVEDAVTAPVTPKSGVPMPGDREIRTAPPPDPDDLVRGFERDRAMQTPVVNASESRGRDGAAHVAVGHPAQGHASGPAEPLVVVDVSTDPTSRSIASIASADTTPPTFEPLPKRNKLPVVLVLCIFGACLILAVGIIGTLAAKYFPGPAAEPAASSPAAPSAPALASAPPAKSVTFPAPALAVPAPSSVAAASASNAPASAATAPRAPSSATPSAPRVADESSASESSQRVPAVPAVPAPRASSTSARPAVKPSRPASPTPAPSARHSSDLERGID